MQSVSSKEATILANDEYAAVPALASCAVSQSQAEILSRFLISSVSTEHTGGEPPKGEEK